jgi:hypothetical protein
VRGGEHDYWPLHSCSHHHGRRKPLFRVAKQEFSQISGRSVLCVMRHFVLSLSRQCFCASAGDRCGNAQNQRCPLNRALHPLPALFLFWLHQKNQGLEPKANTPRATRATLSFASGSSPSRVRTMLLQGNRLAQRRIIFLDVADARGRLSRSLTRKASSGFIILEIFAVCPGNETCVAGVRYVEASPGPRIKLSP